MHLLFQTFDWTPNVSCFAVNFNISTSNTSSKVMLKVKLCTDLILNSEATLSKTYTWKQEGHWKRITSASYIISNHFSYRWDHQDRDRGLRAASERLQLQAQVRPRAALQPAFPVPEPHLLRVQHTVPLAPADAWNLPHRGNRLQLQTVCLQHVCGDRARHQQPGGVIHQASGWTGKKRSQCHLRLWHCCCCFKFCKANFSCFFYFSRLPAAVTSLQLLCTWPLSP